MFSGCQLPTTEDVKRKVFFIQHLWYYWGDTAIVSHWHRHSESLTLSDSLTLIVIHWHPVIRWAQILVFNHTSRFTKANSSSLTSIWQMNKNVASWMSIVCAVYRCDIWLNVCKLYVSQLVELTAESRHALHDLLCNSHPCVYLRSMQRAVPISKWSMRRALPLSKWSMCYNDLFVFLGTHGIALSLRIGFGSKSFQFHILLWCFHRYPSLKNTWKWIWQTRRLLNWLLRRNDLKKTQQTLLWRSMKSWKKR